MAATQAKRSKRRPTVGPKELAPDSPQRLQKLLAAAGLGSRRSCEQLIVDGRVEVDDQTVTELGTRVDPSMQRVRVDGEPLRRLRTVYYAVNKPKGVVSTNRDPEGRTRVIDLVGHEHRLFTVGRLDMASEGLILATNDGELAHCLMHPRFQVERTYQVVVAGEPSTESLNQLRRGIHLSEARVQVASLRVKRRHKKSTILEMVLTEGRNREIRRMAASIGHKVMSLKRVAYGPLKLGDLPIGAFRELNRDEIRRLRDLVHRRRVDLARGATSAGNTARTRQDRAAKRGNASVPSKSTDGTGSEGARESPRHPASKQRRNQKQASNARHKQNAGSHKRKKRR